MYLIYSGNWQGLLKPLYSFQFTWENFRHLIQYIIYFILWFHTQNFAEKSLPDF